MTAGTYAWAVHTDALTLNFCLTFVRGLDPDAVISRLGGTNPVTIASAETAFGADEAVQERVDEHGTPHPSELSYLAATRAGGWTMVVEPNGYLCTHDDAVRALSARGEMVSFYFNENTTPRFGWALDGTQVVGFDPGYPQERYGSDPGRLDGVLNELGFVLEPGDEDDEEFMQRTLALMERITGVRWDAEFLRSATFRCAGVGGVGSSVTAQPWYAEVREELAAYADDPRDWVDDDFDRWGERGVHDKRIKALGSAGTSLYDRDPELAAAIAYAPPDLIERMTLWARDWPFRLAGILSEAWFAPIRDLVQRGEPVPDTSVRRVQQHLAAHLRTVSPLYRLDDRRDSAVRQMLNHIEADGPLVGLCRQLATAGGAGPQTQLYADLRRDFPELAHITPPPPQAPPPERDARRRKREAAEQRDEKSRIAHLTRWWGGRIPRDQVLRPEVAPHAHALVEHDRDLIDRITEADPRTQRAVAIWAARNCCTRAALIDRDWVRAGVEALERGEPAPPWFTDFTTAHGRLRKVPAESITLQSTVSIVPFGEKAERPRLDPAIPALDAVIAARHDDPLIAVFTAVRHLVQLDPADPATPITDLRRAFHLTQAE